MPLVTDRSAVLATYADAAGLGWVVPAFGAENPTTVEAVLAATREHAERLDRADLPVTVAITNLYSPRSQSVQYSRTGDWRVGLELFLADLGVLAGPGSPFAELRVMVHLDHVQPGTDAELLDSGLGRFSSIMFDASGLPAEENVELTRRFVERRGREIVIEGACDRIAEAGEGRPAPPQPAEVERYAARTGVDMVVADLGTEHRAGAAERRYRAELARGISRRIGPRLVLHGCSSVPPGELAGLFADGVCKVNVWTMLERDSSPALLAAMVRHSSRVAGPAAARALAEEGFLGPSAELSAGPDLEHFTTAHRQGIVFERMREMVGDLLRLWYR